MGEIERELAEDRIAELDSRIAELDSRIAGIKAEIRQLESARILEAREAWKVSLRLQFPQFSESQLETYVKGR